jgi:hypothetical protein
MADSVRHSEHRRTTGKANCKGRQDGSACAIPFARQATTWSRACSCSLPYERIARGSPPPIYASTTIWANRYFLPVQGEPGPRAGWRRKSPASISPIRDVTSRTIWFIKPTASRPSQRGCSIPIESVTRGSTGVPGGTSESWKRRITSPGWTWLRGMLSTSDGDTCSPPTNRRCSPVTGQTIVG